jgi:hypothetical protein
MDQLPLHRGAFQNAQRTFLGNFNFCWKVHAFNRPVNLAEIFEKKLGLLWGLGFRL